MKTLTTTLVLSLALMGGAAQAGPAGFGDSDNATFQGVYGQSEPNSLTRAQVQAELRQAQAAGQVAVGEVDNAPFQAAAESTTTRAEVQAELRQARAEGLVTFGEADDAPYQANYASVPSKQQEAKANDGVYTR